MGTDERSSAGGRGALAKQTLRSLTACLGKAGWTAGSPRRSTRIELPSSIEKPMRAQGRNGAWKVRRPKKLTLTRGLRRLHTYTSMAVRAWPRKKRLPRSPSSWARVKASCPAQGPSDFLNPWNPPAGWFPFPI